MEGKNESNLGLAAESEMIVGLKRRKNICTEDSESLRADVEKLDL